MPAEPAADTAESTPDDVIRKPSMTMRIVKAVAVVSVVVLLEVAAASMLVPGAMETRLIAEQLVAAEGGEDRDESATSEEISPIDEQAKQLGETHEVALGSYHIVTPNTKTGSSINVTFNLFGAVLAEEEELFNVLYNGNQQRIREQVLITMRGMSVSDYTDPNLGLIKRKILEKTNRALGKPLVHEAIISEFAFVER
ncbi:hypothetical protein OAS39_07130 [Pirellulales bacterium]|nr:hypothetical protein [Pirellulales bacterium]